MSESSARPEFLPALTGIRAFAAVWVVALHLTGIEAVLFAGNTADALMFLGHPGFLGVDVFFVLSGFIISYNYARTFEHDVSGNSYGRFLWARLARIYPVHLATLIPLVVAVKVLGLTIPDSMDPDRFSDLALLECVILINGWLAHVGAWNAPAWSISAEWFAYLTFPALSRAAAAIVRRVAPAFLIVLVVLLSTVPAVEQQIERSLQLEFVGRYLLQIVAEFGAGCLVYRAFTRSWYRNSAWLAEPLWFLLVLVVGAALMHHAGLPEYWTVPLVPPLILGLAYNHGGLSRFFSTRLLVYGGKISFALYMTQRLWLWFVQYVTPPASYASSSLATRVAILLWSGLPMLVAAVVVYHVVEEPARRVMMRRFRPLRSRTAV